MMANLPPILNLCISFDTHAEYVEYAERYKGALTQIWRFHETIGNQPGPVTLPGVCEVCASPTTFVVSPREFPDGAIFRYRAGWWGSLACTHCRLPTLERSVMRALVAGETSRIYHVGHHSTFRKLLFDRLPCVVSSQYEAGRRPGETANGIRYEDLTCLSFPSDDFHAVVCLEVLEHIPDHLAALREMARILKPGGRAIMTFPWLGGAYFEHLIRAEILPDGSINHILPPEYHGDPASKGGILSFRAFGWSVLDEIRAAGFSRASARYVYAPLHGYMTMSTPVIVAIR